MGPAGEQSRESISEMYPATWSHYSHTVLIKQVGQVLVPHETDAGAAFCTEVVIVRGNVGTESQASGLTV